MQDFDLLLAEAKKRGIRIVMDCLLNTDLRPTSLFIQSRSSQTKPEAGLYIWRDGKGTTAFRPITGQPVWALRMAVGRDDAKHVVLPSLYKQAARPELAQSGGGRPCSTPPVLLDKGVAGFSSGCGVRPV